ncbi:MAG: hypothetical protein JRI97_11715 [Deltaproteobacteria bacterium]|nr:hypothetical protein [Deltaproteobacteria bacterium]
MASNFRIIKQGADKSFRLSLMGSFDKTSAAQLARTLTTYGRGAETVVVCTSGLEDILPDGPQGLRQWMSGRKNGGPLLLFTGWNAEQVAPPGSTVLHE